MLEVIEMLHSKIRYYQEQQKMDAMSLESAQERISDAERDIQMWQDKINNTERAIKALELHAKGELKC